MLRINVWRSRCLAAVVVVGAMVIPSESAVAQFPPDSLVNLQVLPDDIGVRGVINVMRGFAIGLGVRCQHCHVGEAGQPLSTFDFAADEKPAKAKAREMLQMVSAINGQHLAGLSERSDPPVEVTCATCHHGNARPITLAADLMETYTEAGSIAPVIARYRELREAYYGSWTYDFGESSLSDFATGVAQGGNLEDAAAVLNLNLEFFPESPMVHFGLGQVRAQQGNNDEAIRHLERSLELAPGNPAAQRLLERLRGN